MRGMNIRAFVLALSLSACGADPELGAHSLAISNAFFKFEGIPGESTNRDGAMVSIDLASQTGQMIVSCVSLACQVADVQLEKPSPNPGAAWQVRITGNDEWRGELVLRRPRESDLLLAKLVNLETLTGVPNLGGSNEWYPLAPAEQVSCSIPDGCDAPIGYQCLPICRFCSFIEEGCF